MASVFGHGIVAYTTARLLDSKSSKLLVFLAITSAILPDLDVLAFKLGIDYGHPLGHRGFTHSILFAFIWSGILSIAFGKTRKFLFMVVLFLSTISHGLLDAITTGGMGVGFFVPFENSRYFFPLRVVQVSPIGVEAFFSEWGIRVILSELKYIVVPCCIILITLLFVRKSNNGY